MQRLEPDYNGLDLVDSLRMLENIQREASALGLDYPPFIDPEISRIRKEIARQTGTTKRAPQ